MEENLYAASPLDDASRSFLSKQAIPIPYNSEYWLIQAEIQINHSFTVKLQSMGKNWINCPLFVYKWKDWCSWNFKLIENDFSEVLGFHKNKEMMANNLEKK